MTSTEAVAQLEQGSEDWISWRRTKIGSSDMPIIMGESEYDTPRGLWRKKKGLDPDTSSNWAMNRGTENEPKIRALYELQTGHDVPSAIVVHPDFPWAIASLDGDNEEQNLLVEFKYPSAETHAIAQSGQIPPKYRSQVQWQLFVSGRKRAHYVSLAPDGVTIEVVAVTLDAEYLAKMLTAATIFHDYLVNNEEPPLTDRDYKDLDGPDANQIFSAWKEAKVYIDAHEPLFAEMSLNLARSKKVLDSSREEIQKFLDHPKVRCAGVKAQMVKRKNGPVLQVSLVK